MRLLISQAFLLNAVEMSKRYVTTEHNRRILKTKIVHMNFTVTKQSKVETKTKTNLKQDEQRRFVLSSSIASSS